MGSFTHTLLVWRVLFLRNLPYSALFLRIYYSCQQVHGPNINGNQFYVLGTVQFLHKHTATIRAMKFMSLIGLFDGKVEAVQTDHGSLPHPLPPTCRPGSPHCLPMSPAAGRHGGNSTLWDWYVHAADDQWNDAEEGV